MESTVQNLQRQLKEAGSSKWPEIVEAVNEPGQRPITLHTLRKIAYGERPNLGSAIADRIRRHLDSQGRPRAKRGHGKHAA